MSEDDTTGSDLHVVDDLPEDPPALDTGTRAKRTRYSKFTAKRKAMYLENLRQGMRRGAAAEAAGVSRWTVSNHRRADEKFAAWEAQAEEHAIELVEDALFQAATSGNVTAIQVYLYNRAPTRWGDRRNVAHTGADGGPIKVETEDAVSAEIRRLLEKVGDVGALPATTPAPKPI